MRISDWSSDVCSSDVLALFAAVDDAADTDQVAWLETHDVATHRRHTADDLVPRHARILRARPFRTHLVDVGVAQAAVGDVDLHIVGAQDRKSTRLNSSH